VAGLDNAAAEFQAAISAEPEYVAAHRALARLRAHQERGADSVASFREVLRLAPDDGEAHAELGLQLLKLKQNAEAAEAFREALRLRPEVSVNAGNFNWANNLAWILATSHDAKVRNGAEAVEWAQRACQAEGYRNPSMLDTLAAALAEAGRFDEAIKMAERQIEMSRGNDELIEAARERIKLYRAGKPYREE
jgi:Flp pilus assembly protein TadD